MDFSRPTNCSSPFIMKIPFLLWDANGSYFPIARFTPLTHHLSQPLSVRERDRESCSSSSSLPSPSPSAPFVPVNCYSFTDSSSLSLSLLLPNPTPTKPPSHSSHGTDRAPSVAPFLFFGSSRRRNPPPLPADRSAASFPAFFPA